jgi:hypothetical protein
MSMQIKLLFGLRTSESVTLTVNAVPDEPAPDLRILSNGQTDDVIIAYANEGWRVRLVPGDHVVRIETPADSDFAGVQFTLSPAATIIGGDVAEPSKLVAWTAPGAVNNPKDPRLLSCTAVPLVEESWLSQTLRSLASTIPIDSADRSMPVSP